MVGPTASTLAYAQPVSLLDGYRENWPRIGAAVGMGIVGATGLASKRMSRPQMLSALNLAALIVHQYEEYEDAGYFPGQFNRRVFHSETPDHAHHGSLASGYKASSLVAIGFAVVALLNVATDMCTRTAPS
jgi:hypothetical protein